MARTVSTEHEAQSFMSIVGGKWAEKVEKGTPNSKERKNKKDVIVHELMYDDVTGVIQSMKIEKKEFGKQLNIVINDAGEAFTLSIPVESKYFDTFASKIGYADLKRPVRLVPFHFVPTGETDPKSGMNIYQEGNQNAKDKNGNVDPKGKLPYFFTKEDPKGRPQPEKDGKPLVDGDTLEEEEWKGYFLKVSVFNQKYIEKLATSLMGKPVASAPDSMPDVASADPKSDLPF